MTKSVAVNKVGYAWLLPFKQDYILKLRILFSMGRWGIVLMRRGSQSEYDQYRGREKEGR